MSAFQVSHNHIRALVTAAQDHGVYLRTDDGHDRIAPLGRINPDDVCAMLTAENAASVGFRYAHDDEMVEHSAMAVETRPRFTRVAVSPVQVLKAIDCYRYQSCEHESWDGSPAEEFCDRLMHAVISRLPGYRDAAWEIQ